MMNHVSIILYVPAVQVLEVQAKSVYAAGCTSHTKPEALQGMDRWRLVL